jgi:hypothetical protein
MKFALALIATAVSAQWNFGYDDAPQNGGYGGNGLGIGGQGFGGQGFGDGFGIGGQGFGGHSAGYGGNDGYGQPTYAPNGNNGYEIFNRPRVAKVLVANDGYRVKTRSDPYERLYETVNAKCVLEDPEEESYVRGVISMSQGAKDV